jgi:hypothetical protein
LYEFTVGARIAIIARACYNTPAMYDFAMSLKPYLSLAS